MAATDLPARRATRSLKTPLTEDVETDEGGDDEPPTRSPLREIHPRSKPPKVTISNEFSEASEAIDTKEIEGHRDPLLRGFEGVPHIISVMANNTYALKHQANTLVANIRGRHARVAATATARTQFQLADILPLVTPAPKLSFPPTTRVVAASGRIRFTINGQTLTDLLGWSAGPLTTSLDGAWVVLSPSSSERPARRNDGRATYCGDQRIRLSEALCTMLELGQGDEVALVVVPEHKALALCNPNRLLQAAPLSLLNDSGTPQNHHHIERDSQ